MEFFCVNGGEEGRRREYENQAIGQKGFCLFYYFICYIPVNVGELMSPSSEELQRSTKLYEHKFTEIYGPIAWFKLS